MQVTSNLRVLHVCECLPGGPASYLQEVLPTQVASLGPENVAVIGPEDQISLVSGFGCTNFTYTQKRRSPLAMVRLASRIRYAIRVFKPDILHLHSTLAGAVGRLVVATLDRKPKVLYCAHGWMIDPDRPTRWRPVMSHLERKLSSLTDKIINISPHESQILSDARFPDNKVHLVVSGIKDQVVAPTPRHDTDRPLNLLFIGRLDYQKGFDLLLDAAALITQGSAHITVVGDVVRGGVQPNTTNLDIEMKGWLPRAEVMDAIAHADAVVMPSRWEGLPLVALEAMRSGRALIATNGGAFRHLIDHGVNGLLVNNRDPKFLVDIVQEYSPVHFANMGLAARKAFEENFLADRMNSELLSLYEQLVQTV